MIVMMVILEAKDKEDMMEMIDDTMTTGMLNSFNSGAFQISCLRWAAHSLINDDNDEDNDMLRFFRKEIMMMLMFFLMRILTLL